MFIMNAFIIRFLYWHFSSSIHHKCVALSMFCVLDVNCIISRSTFQMIITANPVFSSDALFCPHRVRLISNSSVPVSAGRGTFRQNRTAPIHLNLAVALLITRHYHTNSTLWDSLKTEWFCEDCGERPRELHI